MGPDHVDIITFYNEMFIPAVKPLLVEIIPVKKDQAMEANNKPEGSLEMLGYVSFLSMNEIFKLIDCLILDLQVIVLDRQRCLCFQVFQTCPLKKYLLCTMFMFLP